MREIIFTTATKYFALISSFFYHGTDNVIIKKYLEYLKSFSFDCNIDELKKLFTDSYTAFDNEPALFEDPELSSQSFISSFGDLFSETVHQLELKDRFILLHYIIDYFIEIFPDNANETKYLELASKRLGISSEEFFLCYRFVSLKETNYEQHSNILTFKPLSEKTEVLEGSWIDKNKPEELKIANEFEDERLECKMYILFLDRLKVFVVKCSADKDFEIDGCSLSDLKYKIIEPGDEISYKKQHLINFSEIKLNYLKSQATNDLSFLAENLHYSGTNKKNALRGFYGYEDTGKLIGILGKEGVGKTTLLELIAGRITPVTGRIVINGYNLDTNKYLLKSLIGFVPEEDMLFDELTVFDNLMLTARLFYNNLPTRKLELKVNRLLEDIDLYEIKNKIVGSVFDKNIQPGQRRLLNIALELIREPKILIVDNAVYGLGTTESSKILKILSDYTFKGNLVITTLSQTSTYAFQLFDKLWIIDESGYPVYNGETNLAADYFKFNLKIAGTNDPYKERSPEYILDLVNFKILDSTGKIGKRKVEPAEWHQVYLEKNRNVADKNEQQKLPLPANYIKLPNLETQFKLFNIRNFKVKFSNTRKIIYIILAGPFLAFLLSIILKKSTTIPYSFYANENIPFFLFSSVIIALLLGLLMSSNEIIKEKNIHSKEVYLEFSRFSYINSKITFLFLIGAFQTFLFALTGNSLLEIKNYLLPFWLILYSACCFGILFGLILSSVHHTIDNIYEKSIPIFLALQIFLGGGIISYKNLNLNKSPYVPVAGDLMVSKWAYEALMVEQFRKNKFEELIYPYERNHSHASFYLNHLIPEMERSLNRIEENNPGKDSLSYYLKIIQNGIISISSDGEVFPFEYVNQLNSFDYSEKIVTETRDYLTYLDLYYFNRNEELTLQKEERFSFLNDSLAPAGFIKMRNTYHNRSVAELVTRPDVLKPWKVVHRKIYQINDPIYQNPQSDFGRAMLFLPEKKIRGENIDTFLFNITVIWLFSLLLYVILVIDLPSVFSGTFKFQSVKQKK